MKLIKDVFKLLFLFFGCIVYTVFWAGLLVLAGLFGRLEIRVGDRK